ncbi:MAG: T9SS type A sorting domain-containing protein, partial [Bacteroidales bacterium]
TETEEGSDELVICKNNNSKLDFEQFDSEKLFNDSPVEIYSQSTSGENLVINTINATANNIIPLGIRGNAGKKVKITAFALETAEQVYLEDRFKGKLISLTENTAYEFELPTESLIGRFFIRFNNTNAALTTSDVKVFENDNELNIITQTGENIEQVEVFTVTGSRIFKTDVASNMLTTKLDLTTGVYLVRVRTNLGSQNVKVNWR